VEQRRTYYACARFIRLNEILPDITTSILCIDADSLFVNPIDLNFSDKSQAELCIIRRDLAEQVPDFMAVANGTIWLKPTPLIKSLVANVACEISRAFMDGSANWYLDQIVMGKEINNPDYINSVFNLKKKYADWDFHDASIIWSGKGSRKLLDMRFSMLQKLLSDNPEQQGQSIQVIQDILSDENHHLESFRLKLNRARTLTLPRVMIVLPRLDLPWKPPKDILSAPSELAEDTLNLRIYWKEFTVRLANAIERHGVKVEVIEIPGWQIEGFCSKSMTADLAIIPHRCKIDFRKSSEKVMFYMQEFFRWVFVLDEQGWGAASSVYPILLEKITHINTGPFDDYRQQLLCGQLVSKFHQGKRMDQASLIMNRQIPDAPYIFFPLQIPNDQILKYFSDVSELAVVEALVAWAKRRDVALVIKPHPANLKSMKPFKLLSDSGNVYWSDAHVYDLIEHALAVYTVNSGVGFEALLHIKPVVTFGRTEYDCVTFNANLNNLDDAYEYCCTIHAHKLETRYRRFIDWFLGNYAIDMSNPERAKIRLDAMANAIVRKIEDIRSAVHLPDSKYSNEYSNNRNVAPAFTAEVFSDLDASDGAINKVIDFTSKLNDISEAIKKVILHKDKLLASQKEQLQSVKTDLIRTEAQLELLKDVIFTDRTDRY
jgi:hypothetical protein